MTNEVVVAVGDSSSEVGRSVVAEEIHHFPEAPELFADAPDSQSFVFLGVYLDGELVHGMRLSSTDGSEGSVPFFVWDMCRGHTAVTTLEISRALEESGARLSECASVESNFRIRRVKGFRGGPVAYGVLSHLRKPLGGEDGVLAHLNRAARISFAQAGIVADEPFGDHFGTPSVDGGIDLRYTPALIRTTDANNAALANLFEMMPITIKTDSLPRIDLTTTIVLDEDAKADTSESTQ